MAAPSLRIPVSVDLEGFKSAMTEAGRRVHEEAEHIEGHFTDINKAAAAMAVAVAGSGVALTTALLNTVTSLAKIGDLSQDLRLPVNLIQALSVAATEARVPAALLTTALEKFTAASKLGGTDAELFEKALGNIGAGFVKAFKDATSQEERLKIISNALKSTTDEVKRAQLSLQVFGTDNERLTGVLGSGAAAFDLYKENARKLGLEINDGLVKSAQDAKSQLLLLSRVLSDEFTSAVGDLIPVLVRLLPYLNAIALAGQAVATIFATDDTASTKQLKDELDGLIDRWTRLKQAKNDLESGSTSQSDSLRDKLRKLLGIEAPLDEEIKSLDADLAKVQERIDTVKKLIASKDATPVKSPPAFEPREPLKDPSSGGRDRFEASADAIEKRTKAMEAEVATINLGTEAREKAKIAAQLLTVAEQINKEAGVNNGKATEEQIATIEKFSAAFGKASLAIERAHSPLQTFFRDSVNLEKQLNQFAATSLDNLSTSIVDVINHTKSMDDAFRQLGLTVVTELEKIIVKMLIVKSLQAVGGLFGFETGGIMSSKGPIASPFADGGIMSSGGRLPLNRYAGGGVATGPQMAVFGEGAMNEAYVPLPDGRSIPVVMKGGNTGGGDMEISVNVDVSGARGDSEIEQMTHAAVVTGVQQGLRQYDQALPGRIKDINRRQN